MEINLFKSEVYKVRPYLELYSKKTNKSFRKYFDTEFERDKFVRKLRYSHNLIVLEKGDDYSGAY